jgi:hypothetical protein
MLKTIHRDIVWRSCSEGWREIVTESGLDRLCVCVHGEGVLQSNVRVLRERGRVCHGGHDEVVCEKYIC